MSRIRFAKINKIGFQFWLLFILLTSLSFSQESQPLIAPADKPIVIQVKNIEFTLKKKGIDIVLITLNQPAAINLFALD
ncbi:MAG: hypothetical protein EHM45_04995, partial [Desulfobacteraceae bacterium]